MMTTGVNLLGRIAAPRLRWQPCTTTTTITSGFDDETIDIISMDGFECMETVEFMVPANYTTANISSSGAVNRQFALYVRRWRPLHTTTASRSRIKTSHHMIMLAGGPGGSCASYLNTIRALSLDMPITFYLVDHRGCGRSAMITDLPASQWSVLFPQSPENTNTNSNDNNNNSGDCPLLRGTLQPAEISMTNAALDVILFGKALSTPSKATDKYSLYGVSYGAQLANRIVQLQPSLFDVAFLIAIPQRRPDNPALTAVCSHTGLVEHCMGDAHCRLHLGQTPLEIGKNVEGALRAILTPTRNACTMAFHRHFVHQGHLSTTVYNSENAAVLWVMTAMNELLVMNSDRLQSFGKMSGSVLAVAFIQATCDCLHPELYETEVLQPIMQVLNRTMTMATTPETETETDSNNENEIDGSVDLVESGNSRPSYNELVNRLVIGSKDYDFSPETPPSQMMTINYHNLHPDSTYANTYRGTWQQFVRHGIPWPPLEHEVPIRSERTAIHFAHSLLDMVTPVAPAYESFLDTVAPTKSWMLFHHLDHRAPSERCLIPWVHGALLGDADRLEEAFACVQSENRRERSLVQWSMASTPFAALWHQVIKHGDNPPDYMIVGGGLKAPLAFPEWTWKSTKLQLDEDAIIAMPGRQKMIVRNEGGSSGTFAIKAIMMISTVTAFLIILYILHRRLRQRYLTQHADDNMSIIEDMMVRPVPNI